jgi:hypothetical protein
MEARAQLVPSFVDPFEDVFAESLTATDRQLIAATDFKPYHDPAAEVGAVAKWENPESGNSGTSTLIEKFESHGMPCKRVRDAISVKGFADPTTLEFKRCKFPNGEWEIV